MENQCNKDTRSPIVNREYTITQQRRRCSDLDKNQISEGKDAKNHNICKMTNSEKEKYRTEKTKSSHDSLLTREESKSFQKEYMESEDKEMLRVGDLDAHIVSEKMLEDVHEIRPKIQNRSETELNNKKYMVSPNDYTDNPTGCNQLKMTQSNVKTSQKNLKQKNSKFSNDEVTHQKEKKTDIKNSPNIVNKIKSGIKDIFGQVANHQNLENEHKRQESVHGIEVENYICRLINNSVMMQEDSYEDMLIDFLETQNMKELTKKYLNNRQKISNLLVIKSEIFITRGKRMLMHKVKEISKECIEWYLDRLSHLDQFKQSKVIEEILKLTEEKQSSNLKAKLLGLFCDNKMLNTSRNSRELVRFCIYASCNQFMNELKSIKPQIHIIQKEVERENRRIIDQQRSMEEEMMIRERERCLEMQEEEDLYEFIDKLQNGGEAQLQLLIEYLVKIGCSFADIKKKLMKIIDIDESVLSSHYIMSSVETIKSHKWNQDIVPYVVIGNVGCGKSSLVHYLNKNLVAERVTCYEQWNLDVKSKDAGPIISHSLSKAGTIIPRKYDLHFTNSQSIIYDTPGFNIPDSYEQEIASCLSLQQLLISNEKCKIIPCFSIYELQGRGFLFHKFLDHLSDILKLPQVNDEAPYYSKKEYYWPSVYVVTKTDVTLKNRVIVMLRRFIQDAPQHTILIEDICDKLVVFPQPVNGKFVGDLPHLIPLLQKESPVPTNIELPISDGARNKMRKLLDVWDTVLKKQMDKLFIGIIEPLIYQNSLDYDIEFLKKFETISKIEDIPEFLFEIGSPLENDTEADKSKKDVYVIIAATLSSIIPYRKNLIELSGKRESGIFEAYLENQIKHYIKEAKYILYLDFLINLKILNLGVNSSLRSKYAIVKGNETNLKNLLKSKVYNEEYLMKFLQNEMNLSYLINQIKERKQKLIDFGYDQSEHYDDIIREIGQTLIERQMMTKDSLEKDHEIKYLRETVNKQHQQLLEQQQIIEQQHEELIQKENIINELEEEIEQKNKLIDHYKAKVEEYKRKLRPSGIGGFFGKLISCCVGFVAGTFSGFVSEIKNPENYKKGYKMGKKVGSVITKTAVQSVAAGVGALKGLCDGVSKAEVKKAWNSGRDIGETISKNAVEGVVKAGGMVAGVATGGFKANFKKAAIEGFQDGQEIGKAAVETVISTATKSVGIFAGICQADIKKSVKEGFDSGVELGKGAAEFVATNVGRVAGVATGLTKAEYSKKFNTGLNQGEKFGKIIGESSAYMVGGVAGVGKGLCTANYSGSFRKGMHDGTEVGKAVGEGAAYIAGGTVGIGTGLATADYAKAAQEGYQDGVKNGGQIGDAIGRTAGNVVGFCEGGFKGVKEGYDKGHKEGYQKGREVGGKVGYFFGDTFGKVHGFIGGMGEELGHGYENGRVIGKPAGKQFIKNNPWMKAVGTEIGVVVGGCEGFWEGGKELIQEGRQKGLSKGKNYIKNSKVAKFANNCTEKIYEVNGQINEVQNSVKKQMSTLNQVGTNLTNAIKF
ncbi:unnamed protein product [Moneuplotes crassus]|uniref:Uncharacterized protein n=1 Tax=Euplotes crassus TaxID=5936 RepID=A0AAD2DAL0_EUPCR|nr:unnamed protein product [Moneuplotes crassus]